jgi:hypothetical protein
VWWYTPVIPTCGKLRQEDHKFNDSLVYIEHSKPLGFYKTLSQNTEKKRKKLFLRLFK